MSTKNPNTGEKAANAGQAAGNFIKSGLSKIHGAGEAIRGNLNSFADNATFTDDSRSKVVADRGMREMRSGVYEGTGAGVTPNDTAQERVNRQEQGEGAMSGRTATGTATGPTTTGTSHQAV